MKGTGTRPNEFNLAHRPNVEELSTIDINRVQINYRYCKLGNLDRRKDEEKEGREGGWNGKDGGREEGRNGREEGKMSVYMYVVVCATIKRSSWVLHTAHVGSIPSPC